MAEATNRAPFLTAITTVTSARLFANSVIIGGVPAFPDQPRYWAGTGLPQSSGVGDPMIFSELGQNQSGLHPGLGSGFDHGGDTTARHRARRESQFQLHGRA